MKEKNITTSEVKIEASLPCRTSALSAQVSKIKNNARNNYEQSYKDRHIPIARHRFSN